MYSKWVKQIHLYYGKTRVGRNWNTDQHPAWLFIMLTVVNQCLLFSPRTTLTGLTRGRKVKHLISAFLERKLSARWKTLDEAIRQLPLITFSGVLDFQSRLSARWREPAQARLKSFVIYFNVF